jgi:enhancing lycopene biosynthesis protein 2
MWALAKNELEYECFAPDKNQYHVINHYTGKVTDETRNVLVESARIARGKIKPLKDLNVNEFSGVLLPGGTGAIKNLSTYAVDGADFTVDDEVANIIKTFHEAKKPIAALCIAPVVISKILGAKVTIGNDKKIAADIVKSGGKHINKEYDEVEIDEVNLVVTNPCYMLAKNIYQVGLGAEAAVGALMGLMKRSA